MTVKDKVGIGAQMALQIIEEGKRPMSPDQIKAKYQLEFPFTVKRVVQGRWESPTGRSEKLTMVGAVLTLTSYTYNGRYRDDDNIISLAPDSERFVYVDGGVS